MTAVVIRLANQRDNAATITLLRALLVGAIAGDVLDVSVRARTSSGELFHCTGKYSGNESAVVLTLRKRRRRPAKG
jgi:hypothetical protein